MNCLKVKLAIAGLLQFNSMAVYVHCTLLELMMTGGGHYQYQR